ncbi:hypothetical protein SCP_1002870 [Sparassis crispa]|uniref:Uncharacterized protein n=1 Tax=Sparassis crispa TaxID=139825 RepID=A0A401GXY1_9APHY|nr:hypothetical protein SCP_1002870 [Sparassis crispa]GBE87040.1 hypothetical protein SCP_1002870 [Sparassis crispa]
MAISWFTRVACLLRHGSIPHLVLALAFIQPVLASVNFDQCFAAIQSGSYGQDGGTDNHGNPVPVENATAITYSLCLSACGSDQEPFSWSTFSQQFSAWLLPYLALVSQLPFGAKHRLGNLTSVYLTVGSPTLAAYSLALTVLNGRWVAGRFSRIAYPNAQKAARILGSLQQAQLRISYDDALLSSLVVLHENNAWWDELADALDYTHTWSIAALTQIVWVVAAYVFTVVQSLTDINSNINSNGQGVGSVWLWLLPIVGGWLQLSPKCDTVRLRRAFDKTNPLPFVTTPTGEVVKVSSITDERALSIDSYADGFVRDGHWLASVTRDQELSAPIFNYARFLPWVQRVEDVAAAFRAAAMRAKNHIPVSGQLWTLSEDGSIHRNNRTGTLAQVMAYTEPPVYMRRSHWGQGVFTRMFIASVLALSLQWGTTGAAVIVVWFTPTIGLGCRSGAYLIYGIVSTMVWLILITSSALAHHASPRSYHASSPLANMRSVRLAGMLAIALRRVGKTLAFMNAVWIVLACVFQFSNVFDRCYCNSSVTGLGRNAYDVLVNTETDLVRMRLAWAAGVALASFVALAFSFFVNLIKDPEDEGWFSV